MPALERLPDDSSIRPAYRPEDYSAPAERSKGFLIEVELADHPMPEIRPLPPEEAWVYGRTRDELAPGYVPIEGEPPPGVTDPYPPPPKT